MRNGCLLLQPHPKWVVIQIIPNDWLLRLLRLAFGVLLLSGLLTLPCPSSHRLLSDLPSMWQWNENRRHAGAHVCQRVRWVSTSSHGAKATCRILFTRGATIPLWPAPQRSVKLGTLLQFYVPTSNPDTVCEFHKAETTTLVLSPAQM